MQPTNDRFVYTVELNGQKESTHTDRKAAEERFEELKAAGRWAGLFQQSPVGFIKLRGCSRKL